MGRGKKKAKSTSTRTATDPKPPAPVLDMLSPGQHLRDEVLVDLDIDHFINDMYQRVEEDSQTMGSNQGIGKLQGDCEREHGGPGDAKVLRPQVNISRGKPQEDRPGDQGQGPGQEQTRSSRPARPLFRRLGAHRGPGANRRLGLTHGSTL